MIISSGCVGLLGGIDLTSMSPSFALKKLAELQGLAKKATGEAREDVNATLYGCSKAALGILVSITPSSRKQVSQDVADILGKTPRFLAMVNNPVRLKLRGLSQRAYTPGRKMGPQARKRGIPSPKMAVVESDRGVVEPGLRMKLLLLRLQHSFDHGNLAEKAKAMGKFEAIMNAIDGGDSNTIGEVMEHEVGALLGDAVSSAKTAIPFVGLGLAAITGILLYNLKGKD